MPGQGFQRHVLGCVLLQVPAGGDVVCGRPVRQLRRDDGRITGALLADRTIVHAPATGGFQATPSSAPSTVDRSVPLTQYHCAAVRCLRGQGYDAAVAVANPPHARLVWVSSPRVR